MHEPAPTLKIAYIAAGAAGMYCGSCLHDNTLAAALREQGHDTILVPTYTPTRTDEENLSIDRVFFGGINVYLQQKSALFRHTPWCLDRVLDAPAVLNLVSHLATSTRPEDLGDLTVSMLQGEAGRQRKELDKLARWLREQIQPDLVHLSNSMLIGMARQLGQELRVPILCTLSGEDIFLEKLVEPHYSQARATLRERAGDIDAFVALNRYYADFMAEYLAVDRGRVYVVPHGLSLEGHAPRPPRSASGERRLGYFARICPDKGLHLLVEAWLQLARDPEMPPVRLCVAGYLGAGDRGYFDDLCAQIRAAGLADRFEHAGEVDREGKIAFLQSLDVMSVPTVYRESKGISILESLANAVPVVLPAHGTFPELIEDTGGGVLCEPGNPAALAEALGRLLTDPVLADDLGRRGHSAIVERYHRGAMAEATVALYRQVLAEAATADRTRPAASAAFPNPIRR